MLDSFCGGRLCRGRSLMDSRLWIFERSAKISFDALQFMTSFRADLQERSSNYADSKL